MIFNNLVKSLFECFYEAAREDDEHGFMLKCGYTEENGIIAVSDTVFNEASISTKSFGMNTKIKRYIMITYSGSAKHGPRMKVSDGSTINRSNSNYISIYFDGGDVVLDKKCSLSDIKMSKKEFEAYKALYIRNMQLINIAEDPSKVAYVDAAFVHDELLRNVENRRVERDINGNAVIYAANNPTIVERRVNLKGEPI